MRASREGKDWIFVSDAHFTGEAPAEMESFIRFMDSERERMDRLVILGDFFEFFFGFKKTSKEGAFPFREYLPVLEHLRGVVSPGEFESPILRGITISVSTVFSPNTSAGGGSSSGEWECRLGEKRAFVAHGDLSNPEQWAYRSSGEFSRTG